uniref:C2 domain-containing protein n=1 Tax=Ananas comosus var. bracteatus TaxID=296719 RepID=A0A6V7Q0Y3_ANACO|nr:unnamed protein product [Ananas comosus var. bracteatus]
MNRGSIDLKTISYRDVASSFSFSKPSLYVTIYLLGHGDGDEKPLRGARQLRHRHKTPLLPHRRDPEWDHPVRIYIDGPDPLPHLLLLLRFELTARVHLLRDRVVGAASVPVADLYAAGAGDLGRASYQVTSPDGKPNGVLSFSYIMNTPSPASFAAAKVAAPPPPPPPPKVSLYPSLLDLIPDPPPPPPTTETEPHWVCYPAIDPAPAMDTVVAYPAPAQFSGWCYPAPQCGYCGYFAPPGSCGCPARR